jgi:hypothetical protein
MRPNRHIAKSTKKKRQFYEANGQNREAHKMFYNFIILKINGYKRISLNTNKHFGLTYFKIDSGC